MNYKALWYATHKGKEHTSGMLSKEECKELFHAPRMFKQKIMLTLAYRLCKNEISRICYFQIDS